MISNIHSSDNHNIVLVLTIYLGLVITVFNINDEENDSMLYKQLTREKFNLEMRNILDSSNQYMDFKSHMSK